MKHLPIMLLLCLLAPAAASADEPTEILVIERAHTFMVQRIAFLNNASFGPAVLHPQPGGRYWAVVGEFVSGALTGNMARHSYVAAVRQICDDAEATDCWQLEKLALDQEIIYDRGAPL